MLREQFIKWGIIKATLAITALAVFLSVFLHCMITLTFGEFSIMGIARSVFISMVIAPLLSFYFLKITFQLQKSENALIKSEERYRTILDEIEDGYYEVDAAGNLLFFNDALCDILGYPRSQLVGMNHRKLVEEKNIDAVYNAFNKVFNSGEPSRGFGWEIVRKNGEKRFIDASVSLIYGDDGKPKGFRGIVRDITERKNAEQALSESEEKYRHLFNYAPSGLYEIDFTKGKLVSVNDVVCEYTGYSERELLSMSVYDFLTEESQKVFLERLEKIFNGEEVSDSVEYQIITKQGKKLWTLLNARYIHDENGTPKGATVVIHDIDERKKQELEKQRLEKELRQAHKMEAIGTLAGGIAHDFNNILSAIMGYTEIAMLRAAEDTKLREYLDKVIVACERAREMVRQILAFSRQSDFKRKPVRVSQIVKEAGKLLKASLPSTIEIHMDIDPASGIIDADAIQIHQIIMNLCTNAAHAMKEKGGRLDISLENIELTAKDLSAHEGVKPGSFLKLSISDTGTGIPPETMARMYDPYFSTKPKGQGTGLGLSIVHGLVKTHSGFITVESDCGHGTTFSVFLPRTENELVPEKAETEGLASGSESILFIDDEQSLVDVGAHMLEYLGYRVASQTSSVDALALFKSDPDKFDMIITDTTMPVMTGDQLAREILALRPDIPIIICTGHSDHLTEERAWKLGIRAFVMKPYLIQDLAKTVRKVLDGEVAIRK